jgi:hypothetical protein
VSDIDAVRFRPTSTAPRVSRPTALAAILTVACLLWGWPGSPPGRAAGAGPTDLTGAFARAAETIRRHQTPAGYWTTPVTPGPLFQSPTSELNVFTPAVIIDLLDPVSRETGLTDVLVRARGYLRRQIEATGLVRYHGAPGTIDPPQRGCELPPDADDTALLWRIAPRPEKRLMSAARREIERYRTDDGLYRTWLADEGTHRCFYSRYAGSESNPPDVAVEMHVYLFLAGHDPAAARRLCEALRRRMDDDRIWVWYSVAPLLPVLREPDLARKGCSLRVPESRVERAVPGQEPYMTQARLLKSLLVNEGPAPSPDPYLRALRETAEGGFAKASATPPLLYHNNLSASPPHYHWSEDVGYALWLRLYVETARRWSASLPLPGGSAKNR